MFIKREQFIQEITLKERIQHLKLAKLNDKKVKIINQIIREDKRLTLESQNCQNECLNFILRIIKITLQLYEKNKKLQKLKQVIK